MSETGADSGTVRSEASQQAEERLSSSAVRYALGLLVVVYIFNFIDRSILSILLEPIKEEFHVSDTYLGFLSGIAFAAFYTLMGIPIARWADTGRRTRIIALAIFVWSGMTALQGAARSFAQLAMARVGVGVGEAGCSPPAHSLISDYFPPERRATALAIYALGIPIGSGIGNLTGGWINEWFDWRTAFVVVGLPGLALALLVRFTLPEPVRGVYDDLATRSAKQRPVREVLKFIWGLRSFRHMSFAAALHSFYAYGVGAFIAAFFMRSHGVASGELGTWLAVIACTGGVAGTFFGGYLSDRLSQYDVRWQLWVPALATAISVPFSFFVYLWPDGHTALLLSFPGSVLGGMWLGPTFAMTQTLVPPIMRATASAILLFIINIIGLGLGPQGTGILSDLLEPAFGTESLRYSLLIVVAVFSVWSVFHFYQASRTLAEDLKAKQHLSD